MAVIDDEYVLGRKKITTQEAADYLGMNWWTLVDGLRNGNFPFGTAKPGNGGRWIYNIPGERLYRYKKGLDLPTPEQEIKQEIGKLNEMLERYYGKGAVI